MKEARNGRESHAQLESAIAHHSRNERARLRIKPAPVRWQWIAFVLIAIVVFAIWRRIW